MLVRPPPSPARRDAPRAPPPGSVHCTRPTTPPRKTLIPPPPSPLPALSRQMPKSHRIAILTYLFKEGVVVAKKEWNLPKHPDIEEATNLEVIKLMTSLTSKDLVSCRFSWKHYYWFLNDEGIEWLREYLHLPEDMVPNTLKKAAATRPVPPGRPGAEGADGRPRGPPRFGDRDREGYRGGGDREGGGPPRGFGRGAPRQPA